MFNLARLARTVVALTAVAAVRSGAQAPRKVTPVVAKHFYHDVWRKDDGLPLIDIGAIRQTADGYLWLEGVGDRVARFDGVRFTTMVGGDSIRVDGKFRHETPRLDFVDRAGRLMISYEGGKVLRYDAGRFTTFTPADSVHTYGPQTPAPAADGGFWAVFRDELWRWREGVYARATVTGAPQHGIHALATDAKGTLYIGYRDGRIFRTDGSTATPILAPSHSAIDVIRAVDDSTMVVVAMDATLILRGDRVIPVTVLDSTAIVDDVTSDRHGGIWISSHLKGLLHLDANGTVTESILASDVSSPTVHSMFVDREENLWVGTIAGLERFRRIPFETQLIAGGVANEASSGIAWVDSTTFFTLGDDGLVRRVTLARAPTSMNQSATSATIITNPTRYNESVMLDAGAHGTVWIALHNRIERWSPETGVTTRFPPLDSVRAVYQTLEARDGTVWAMTTRGLYRLEQGRFRAFVPSNAAHLALPRYHGYGILFQDSHDDIWAGSGILMRVSRDSMALFNAKNGFVDYPPRGIYEDRTGTIWLAAGRGKLVRVRGDELKTVVLSTDNGGENINALAGDALDYLWTLGDRGVTRMPLAQLNAVADGRSTTIDRTEFSGLDGLPSLAPVGESRAFARGPNKTLWLALDHSLLRVDPARLRRNDVPPPVHVEALEADDHDVSLDSARKGLAPGSYRVQLHFTANSFSIPSRVRFRYMLDNAEKTWTEATGLQRTATYTRLAPGTYRFRVQASNNDGVWNSVGSALDFRVLPEWYQTWWAAAGGILLIAGAAAGAAWTVARVRQSRSEARLHAMMEERSRMAREIHDTLLQGFTGVTLQLHALKARISQSPETLTAGVERLLEISDATLRSARQAVWEMRPPDLENADLAAALGNALDRASDGWPEVHYKVVGTPRRLEPEKEAAILRIAIEAATNAAKHASAKALDVELAFRPSTIALSVRDDGKGFRVDSALAPYGSHFGLVGMRERARKIGADVTITSAPALGTTVELIAHDNTRVEQRI